MQRTVTATNAYGLPMPFPDIINQETRVPGVDQGLISEILGNLSINSHNRASTVAENRIRKKYIYI